MIPASVFAASTNPVLWATAVPPAGTGSACLVVARLQVASISFTRRGHHLPTVDQFHSVNHFFGGGRAESVLLAEILSRRVSALNTWR